MTGKARCKFQCDSVARTVGTSETVVFGARYESAVPADEGFPTATPWGEMKFGVANPALKGFFEPGKSYYIDITPGDGD